MVSQCYNSAVVTVINSRYSREDSLMRMLRCLFFIEAYFQLNSEQSICQGNKMMKQMACLITGCPPFQKKFPGANSTPFPNSLFLRLDISHLDTTVHFFHSKVLFFQKDGGWVISRSPAWLAIYSLWSADLICNSLSMFLHHTLESSACSILSM